MSVCRNCGAKIDWVETEAGKKMPVDPDRVNLDDCEIGDILVTDLGETIKKTKETKIDAEGYVSHFSTCPKEDYWRKK